MGRSTIIAAAVALFCLSLPHVMEAQRVVPRHSIVKKPDADSLAKAKAHTGGEAADSAAAASVAPGTGSIMGTVVDSLHEQMLVHSSVSVHGLPNRYAMTTDNGAFRIDSVPPGKYVLELTHPLLDSLGIRVVSDTVPVIAGEVQMVELAVPGQQRVISTVCTPAKLRFGPGVILGRVLDADTEEPATGAEVSVAWMQTEIGPVVGLRNTPRVRKDIVAADGTYRICGVPDAFTGTLQAIRGGAKTAEVPIKASNQTVSIRTLLLPPDVVAASGKVPTAAGTTADDSVPVAPVRKVGRAVITGTVTNAGGVPVSGARVSVQGSVSSASTGPDGKFTLTGVLPGTQSILVRRVGYEPVQRPLNVTSLATNTVTVRMGSYTAVLSSVEIKAKADPLESTGFEHRRKMGMGRYMDLDQINKIQPSLTTDLLRRIPGIMVNGSGPGATLATTRGMGCVSYLIDNTTVETDAGQSIDEIVKSQDVAAIEYYSSADVPLELSSGSNGCALLVIWTKGRLDQRKKK